MSKRFHRLVGVVVVALAGTFASDTAAQAVNRESGPRLPGAFILEQVPDRRVNRLATSVVTVKTGEPAIPDSAARFVFGLSHLQLYLPRDQATSALVLIQTAPVIDEAMPCGKANVTRVDRELKTSTADVPEVLLPMAEVDRSTRELLARPEADDANQPDDARPPRPEAAFVLKVNGKLMHDGVTADVQTLSVRPMTSASVLDVNLLIEGRDGAPRVTFFWNAVDEQDHEPDQPADLAAIDAVWKGSFVPRTYLDALNEPAERGRYATRIRRSTDWVARAVETALKRSADAGQDGPDWTERMLRAKTELAPLSDKALLERTFVVSRDTLAAQTEWHDAIVQATLLGMNDDFENPAMTWSDGTVSYMLVSRSIERATGVRLFAFDAAGVCRGIGYFSFDRGTHPKTAWTITTNLLGIREAGNLTIENDAN